MIIDKVILFGPVGPELIVIVLVLVLLFGANKIPELARSFGKAKGEFTKGKEELEEEINSELDDDNESKDEEKETNQIGASLNKD